MPVKPAKRLVLPARDRSFWKGFPDSGLPLLYLAWGRRDFHTEQVPASRHEGWVCVCIEEGSPTILLGGRAVRLSRGQVVLIREECPFGWRQGERQDCRFLLWMWRRPLNDGFARLAPDAYAIEKIPSAQRAIWPVLHGMCREEVLRLDGLSSGWLESCQRQIEVLLLRLRQSSREENPAAGRVDLALEWMRGHPESREPIARLCDFLSISQSTLYRLFASQTGESPVTHFHRIKMEHARSLVERGTLSIKEIAFVLGYRHFNDFSRAYKAHFGHAPTKNRCGKRDPRSRSSL